MESEGWDKELRRRAKYLANIFFDENLPANANLTQCIYNELTSFESEVIYRLSNERKEANGQQKNAGPGCLGHPKPSQKNDN